MSSAPGSPATLSNAHVASPTAAPTPLPARGWYLRPVAEWHRHSCPVLSLHVTADCSTLYSGDNHGLVLQWTLSLADEQRTNVSGVAGVGCPPADASCQCKAAASGSRSAAGSRAALKRYCLCHPRTCRQVVCDHCVLDHIRALHTPAQHRAAMMHSRQRASRDLTSRSKSTEHANDATPTASPTATTDPTNQSSSSVSSSTSANVNASAAAAADNLSS